MERGCGVAGGARVDGVLGSVDIRRNYTPVMGTGVDDERVTPQDVPAPKPVLTRPFTPFVHTSTPLMTMMSTKNPTSISYAQT